MKTIFLAVVLGLAAGCPNKTATPSTPEPEVNHNPYKNVMPKKVKADVEAAQKKEEDRDDKLIEKAKQ